MKKSKITNWTEQENALLIEYYGMLSNDILKDVLSGRTWADILKQVAHLKKKNRLNS